MKTKIYNLMAMIFLASLSFGFTACSDDDENSISSHGTMTIDGKKYDLPYAFYIGEKSLMFSSLNMKSNISPNDNWLYCQVRFDGIKNANDITIGEYSNASVEIVGGTAAGTNEYIGLAGKATVSVAKNGNNYVIDVQMTSVTDVSKGATSSSTMTLHFEGTISDASNYVE